MDPEGVVPASATRNLGGQSLATTSYRGLVDSQAVGALAESFLSPYPNPRDPFGGTWKEGKQPISYDDRAQTGVTSKVGYASLDSCESAKK